jgi:hypothetical protein
MINYQGRVYGANKSEAGKTRHVNQVDIVGYFSVY